MEIDNLALMKKVLSFDGIEPFPEIPSWDNLEIHISGHGVGDAIRIASALKMRMDKTKKQLVLIESEPDLGMIISQNISFIDYVIGIPSKHWRFKMNPTRCLWLFETLRQEQHDYLFSLILGTSTSGELKLDFDDFKRPQVIPALPKKYAVIQPTTTLYKNWVLDFNEVIKLIQEKLNLPIVIIGSQEDKELTPSLDIDIDLRGKLSIEESVWLTIKAEFVAGIESWSTMASCTFGRKSLVFCGPETIRLHKKRWNEYWKSLHIVPFSWSGDRKRKIIDSRLLNEYFEEFSFKKPSPNIHVFSQSEVDELLRQKGKFGENREI